MPNHKHATDGCRLGADRKSGIETVDAETPKATDGSADRVRFFHQRSDARSKRRADDSVLVEHVHPGVVRAGPALEAVERDASQAAAIFVIRRGRTLAGQGTGFKTRRAEASNCSQCCTSPLTERLCVCAIGGTYNKAEDGS
jgi:hypothetical protein